MSKILVRAVDTTPPSLRYLDGRTYLVRPGVTPTEPGHVGTLHGIPGVLVEDAGQLVWEIRPNQPQAHSTGLGDLLAVLTEIRDLLKDYRARVEERWSAPAAASTGSCSGTDTTSTGPSDAKA
jgi:hypothetical protein